MKERAVTSSLFKGRILGNDSGTAYGFARLEVKTGHNGAKPGRPDQSGTNSDAIEKDAFEKGYRAGEEAGLAMGRQKADVIMAGLENILRELSGERERILKEMEPKIFELSLAVAKRIITTELKRDSQGVVQMIKNALSKIQRIGQITVRLNPAIYDIIMERKEELLDMHPDMTFTVDSSVPIHGPVVTSPREEVLLEIDTQIAHILEDIAEAND